MGRKHPRTPLISLWTLIQYIKSTKVTCYISWTSEWSPWNPTKRALQEGSISPKDGGMSSVLCCAEVRLSFRDAFHTLFYFFLTAKSKPMIVEGFIDQDIAAFWRRGERRRDWSWDAVVRVFLLFIFSFLCIRLLFSCIVSCFQSRTFSWGSLS